MDEQFEEQFVINSCKHSQPVLMNKNERKSKKKRNYYI